MCRCRVSTSRSISASPAKNVRSAGRFASLLVALTLLTVAEIPMQARAAYAAEVIEDTATFMYTDSAGQAQSVSSNTVVVTIAQVAAVAVAPADGSGLGGPGDILYYAVSITNQGDGADAFSLTADSASSPAWPVTIYLDDGAGGGIANDGIHQPGETTIASAAASLPAGGVFHCFVAVTVPIDVTVGTIDGTVFTATSQFDAAVSAYAVFTTTAETPRLSGKVLDAASGAGLIANVFVYQGNSLVSSTVAAAPDGSYQFGEELPAGTYAVNAARYGYMPQTVNDVTVTEGATATLDFSLVVASPHTLTVTASVHRATVASGGTTSLTATYSDNLGYGVASWSWSDGGAGGTFAPSASVQNPSYTAAANTTTSNRTVTLAVTATSAADALIAKNSVAITVLPAHTLTVTASAHRATVASGGTTSLTATYSDNLGYGVASWSWSDGGAGGTFAPSASVQNPSYTAAANTTTSNRTVTLTVTTTSAAADALIAKNSVALTVLPAHKHAKGR